jgi:PAS domain S-box-containing protein
VDDLGGLRETLNGRLAEFDLRETAVLAEAVELAAAARNAGEAFSVAVIASRNLASPEAREALAGICAADPDMNVIVCAEPGTACWKPAHRPGRVEFIEGGLYPAHVCQLARLLAAKWTLRQASRRHRQELEAVREKAALLDKVPDAIFAQDLEGRLLSWNPGAERLYGRSADSLLGTIIQPLLGGDPERIREIERITLERGAWNGEYSQRHAEGRELTVESNWTLLRDDQGQPRSLLVINTDITVKKQLELKSLRAQRLETIGTLASGIAHDLNNVLQPISMAMDLFRNQLTDPKSQEVLDLVSHNTRRAANLIRQVLSFARSVDGDRELLHPATIVSEVAAVVRNTFPQTITLRQLPAVEPWPLLGDSAQISEAVLQLCLNARDAMPEGGVLTLGMKNIHIDQPFASLHVDATPGDFVVISVTDTGYGIPEELRDKVFDPFFTTKEPGCGAGLGLTTTLTNVRSHGGFVTLHSMEGRGTTVRLFLPAVKQEVVTMTPLRGPASRQPQPPEKMGAGELVLLVDDEPSVSTVMRLALERAGYRVVVAGNGAEGLRAYEQHRSEIKIVLTDMVMPVMDGPGMIAAIKIVDPGSRIVAMTGMSTKTSLETVRQLGVERVLSKPCSSKVLLSALREVLEK